MTRSSLLLLAASFAGVCSLQAQTTNPLIAETKSSYTSIKGYLTRAAAAMPEENYSFKPTPDIRTFGALMAHIADHQMRFCSSARGEAKKGDPNLTAKADLVAALAASFKECDAAWDSITDANATQMMGQRSKLGTLIVDVMHSNEEYGYMSIYFRLKGIVPPSTDRTGGK
jgi:DinB superfamily